MTQLSEEQQERVRQIRERQSYREEWAYGVDIDFLLSLLDSDSQAAGANYSKLAHEIISEFNSADDPGLLRSKVAECFAQVASNASILMRDKCVEKVKAMRDGCSLVSDDPFVNGVRATYNSVIAELQSLTLDQVKPGEM